MIIIGSRALNHWFPNFRDISGKDYDLVGTYDELKSYVSSNYDKIKTCTPSRPGKTQIYLLSGEHIEFEHYNTEEMYSNWSQNTSCHLINRLNVVSPTIVFQNIGITTQVATPETLLAIKKSHLSVPFNMAKWEKHILDYHFLNSKVPTSKISGSIHTLYKTRLTETEDRNYEVPVKLNMINSDFFSKSDAKVKRYYNHDDLHRATCYYDEPLFEKLKINKEMAMCNHALFLKLSKEDQVRASREEAFSIALERRVIPAIMENGKVNGIEALKYALFRLGTTLTKGWFREFCQDHYLEILNTDVDYVIKFKQAAAEGKIKSI